ARPPSTPSRPRPRRAAASSPGRAHGLRRAPRRTAPGYARWVRGDDAAPARTARTRPAADSIGPMMHGPAPRALVSEAEFLRLPESTTKIELLDGRWSC